MTTVAVTCPPGTRGATTTAAALALTWSGAVVLAEMDPSAGDLAAWWDLTESPGIGTAVTDMHRPDWITANTQQAASGVLVMPAPLRAREASGAVGEATRSVLPAFERVPRRHRADRRRPLHPCSRRSHRRCDGRGHRRRPNP